VAPTLQARRSSSQECHSERSEESLAIFFVNFHEEKSRCFASLNMTTLLAGLIAASFSDAKLAEHRIKNLFHVHDANDFADGAQGLIEINRHVFAG